MPEWESTFYRLGAATLIGALIGVYLELRGKPTGMRTLGFVALASAVAVMALPKEHAADVSRVIQGIITGVGFLGAGVILHRARDGAAVHGLTTAATIWFTASLGVLCGVGAWYILVVALVFAILLSVAGLVLDKLGALTDR